jgi:hypothetical protein
MLLGFIICGVIIAIFIFIFTLYFKKLKNNRNSWEDTADHLGLELQESSNPLFKPMEGIYKDYRVRISNQRIPTGESDYDSFTICEVYLPTKLDFIFQVLSAYSFIQTLASKIGMGDFEIGIPGFDKSFRIGCSDNDKISDLLCVDLENGRTQNLLTELLLIKKSFPEVKITHELAYLKEKGELINVMEIESLIDSTIYLAQRIDSARKKMEG